MRLTYNHSVCELHFRKEDIERFDEVTLPDGTKWRSAEKKPVLKKGAYPQILPNCPKYLSTMKSTRKSALKRELPVCAPIPRKKCKQVTFINLMKSKISNENSK